MATQFSRPLRAAGLAVLSLGTIYALVSAYDPTTFWSTNFIARFPATWQAVLLIALGAAGLLLITYSSGAMAKQPKTSSKSEKRKPAKEQKVDLTERPFVRWPAVVAIVFAALCFAFPIEWSMLGDSTLFLGYGFRFQTTGYLAMPPREFLSAILSQTLFGLLSSLSDAKVESVLPFRIIGAVAGFIWCFVSIKLADLITDNKPLKYLTLVLLLTCAGSIFFFGYVETYPLPYAAALWVLYLSMKHLRSECSDVILVCAVMLAMLLHLQNALLLPAVIYAIMKHRKPELAISWKAILGVSVIMLVIYVYFQINPIAKFTSADNPFISIKPVEDVHYTLFSGQHLLDLLNEHLLLAPIALVLFAGLLGSKLDWRKPEIQLILICLFFYEAYLIGGNVQFGMARDWDIFALMGPLFVMLAIMLWKQLDLNAAAYRRLALGASLASLVCMAQWFYANFELKTSLNRYEHLLSVYEPLIAKRNSHYGYENLRKVMRYFHPSQELYVIDKMLDLQPWPVTSERIVSICMQNESELGPSEFAQLRKMRSKMLNMSDSVLLIEEVGEDKLRVDDPHSANVLNHADIFAFLVAFDALVVHQIDSTSAYQLAGEFIQRHPSLPQGYELMSQLRLFLDADHPEAAIAEAQRSLSIDPGRPRPYLYLAHAYGSQLKIEETRHSLRKALELDPNWIDAIVVFVRYLERIPKESRHKEDFDLLRASCKLVLAPNEGLNETAHSQRVAKANEALKILARLELEDLVS